MRPEIYLCNRQYFEKLGHIDFNGKDLNVYWLNAWNFLCGTDGESEQGGQDRDEKGMKIWLIILRRE